MWQLLAVPVAIGVYYVMTKPSAKKPPPKGQPIDLGRPAPAKATPQGNPITPVVTPPTNPRVVIGPQGQPIVNLALPPQPGPTLVSQLQTGGAAVGAAHRLHDFLKGGSSQGMQYQGSTDLVRDFQQASMTDPTAIALGGPLRLDGKFDGATSAALTMYTGDPIPADPSLAPPVPLPLDIATVLTTPGPAALASFNLKMYYKTHQHDKTNPVEIPLVKAFQTAVNTDPSVAGPSSGLGIKLVTKPLLVDGDFGPVPPRTGTGESNTAKAYRLLYGETIDAV